MILDCGHEESPHENFTRGYGTNSEGKKHCYACCSKQDLAFMRKEGKIILYFTNDNGNGSVTNWPGTLKFRTGMISKSRHNFARIRYDYWFILDGFHWHGYTVGNFTQIAHCRRTKDIFSGTNSCLIDPINLI